MKSLSGTLKAVPTVCGGGPVDEDPAGGVAADEVVDEGQHHEEGLWWRRESQAGQALRKRRH